MKCSKCYSTKLNKKLIGVSFNAQLYEIICVKCGLRKIMNIKTQPTKGRELNVGRSRKKKPQERED